ncbi:hypothetical protein GGR54DRAFT_593889 [Hypoxylon sp. NC1633]|nr:hypothetical protein GGR54DRAFT_593889 [Hypoxylon sp. NC1633]
MAPVLGSRGELSSVTLLKEGHEFYDEEDYKNAKKAFLKTMSLCRCGTDVLKQACIRDDILTGIEKESLKTVLENMSREVKRCDNRSHLVALDSFIAAHEAMGQLNRCLSLAAKMVNLCPREPMAFLRLGKILRLKNQPTLAYLAYKQGVELVQRKYPNRAGLKELCAQRDKVKMLAKFDPLTRLPIELVVMIFKLAGFDTQCRSLRVSGTWRKVLTSPGARDLWHIQTFDLRRKKLSINSKILTASFLAYGRYAGGVVTEVYIDSCMHAISNLDLSRLFSFQKHLKVLEFRQDATHVAGTGQYGLALQDKILHGQVQLPKLKRLSLGYEILLNQEPLQQLLNVSAASLEELAIFSLPDARRDGHEWQRWYPDWPMLEKLKVIRLSAPQYQGSDCPLTLSQILHLTPNVEEAWLNDIQYCARDLMLYWTKLRSIFIGNNATCLRINTDDPVRWLIEDIREVHLEGHSLVDFDIPCEVQTLEKLSVLTDEPLTMEAFEFIVRPSMESGSLQELDIRPLPISGFLSGARQFELPHWFKSQDITYLSLTGFAAHGIPWRTLDELLLEVHDRFPNLRIVDFSREQVPDYVIQKFIHGGVKEVYHRSGRKDDLTIWAAETYQAMVTRFPPTHVPSMHRDRAPFYSHHFCFELPPQ